MATKKESTQDVIRRIAELPEKKLMIDDWIKSTPTKPGRYLCREVGKWPVMLAHVRKGNWQLSQNPEWFYATGVTTEAVPAKSLEADWLGPLPLAPREYESHDGSIHLD